MFTHLHWHSHYSLLNAIGTPELIIEKAIKLWMDSIAITDYWAMYGAIEFYEIAQKKWIKPIIGVEIAIVSDKTIKPVKENLTNIVLLAQNYKWYKNLLKLISIWNLEWFNQRSRIDFQDLKNYSEGLIWFMWDSNSYIGDFIKNNETEKKLKELLHYFEDIFGKDKFFLEFIAQNSNKSTENQKINTKILELSKDTWIATIVNNNFHYIERQDKDAYEVLLCIKDGKKLSELDKERTKKEFHIQSEDEIKEILKKEWFEEQEIEKFFQNNQKVKDQINLEIPLGRLLFPNYQSPEYIEKLYEKEKKSLISE